MTRGQRRVHKLLWWAAAPLLLAVVLWSLIDRWHVPASEPPAVLDAEGEAE